MKHRAFHLTILLGLIALLVLPRSVAQQQRIDQFAQKKLQAERAFAEGSFQNAHQLYASIPASEVPDSEKRWVLFRLADTEWRAGAATRQADDTIAERARVQLEQIIAAPDVPHDQIWAEVNESLGDWNFTRANRSDWSAAERHYLAALGFWGESKEIETARRRYLAIVWKITSDLSDPHYGRYNRNFVPLEVLKNAASIVQGTADVARANVLLARRLQSDGFTPETHEAIRRAFEAAVSDGSQSTKHFDTALFEYAMWAEERGAIEEFAANQWRWAPDYPLAVDLYRRFLATFNEGTSKHWRDVRARLTSIVEPSVAVAVPSAFLPVEIPSFMLNARNVSEVQLELYRVSLIKDFQPVSDLAVAQPREGLRNARRSLIRQWARRFDGSADHRPRSEKVELEGKLPAGTYLLEAKSGGKSSSDLLFVTDTMVITRQTGKSLLVFVCDALSGAPRANAEVRVASYADGKGGDESYRTDSEGLVRTSTGSSMRGRTAVIARSGESEAFTPSWWYGHGQSEAEWLVYVLTDRPAYRPEDQVEWKFTARKRQGGTYLTPANEELSYEIRDPRGNVIKEGSVRLNRFGSAWGTLPLDMSMALGMYSISFKDASKRQIDSTGFFRLEEYKLPEFKVSVDLPSEGGKQKLFRTGDTVEATVKAEYYFGGAVSNAEVEVTVEERAFHPSWHRPREFAWYFDDRVGSSYGYGGRTVKSETLRTGADGTVKVTFDTPRDGGENLEYVITARVTDASRRQVEGSGNVRVSSRGYFVQATVDHFIYTPGERARVKFRANDANGTPVQAVGEVVVTREEWVEVWVGDDGKKIRGREVARLRTELGEKKFLERFEKKFSGYEHEKITAATVQTNADGEAVYELTLPREGYYRFAWTSRDQRRGSKFSSSVTAEISVWVARDSTNFIGYRHEGIEILIDQEMARTGETTPVIIIARDPGAHVLFTVDGDETFEARVIQIDGNMRVLQLPIDARFIPNVFLSAQSVRDGEVLGDVKELIVPPREKFLDVTVTSDKPLMQPGEEGSFTITARDHEGKPAATEVTFAVRDASVFSIQNDLAVDPRQRFYGMKRRRLTMTNSSVQHRPFAEHLNRRARKDADEEKGRRETDHFLRDGAMRAGGAANQAEAVAESITVSGNAPSAVSKLSAPPPPPASPQSGGQAIKVRTDFRTTILWRPDLATDDRGVASVKLRYPDSTTTWDAAATAFTTSTQVGSASATVKTRKPLIARLQLPRFLVAGDSVTISGVINNNSDASLMVTPQLVVEGARLESAGTQTEVSVAAGRDHRVDWRVRAVDVGMAKFRLIAAGAETDAMELSIPVVEHGIEKLVAASGKMRDGNVKIGMTLKARRPESTRLTVQVTPSIAVTMLDALPYLIEYPYGCTEQTMSRFLPAVIVANTLRDAGVRPEDVEKKLFGGVEAANVSKTHRHVSRTNIRLLDDVTRQGLDRLYDFQHGDGGWGWWKEGESDTYMTAYVVWGLTLAKSAGLSIREDVLTRGVAFLEKRVVELDDRPADQAWVLHAMAEYRGRSGSAPSTSESRAFRNAFEQRTKLPPYARALLAIAAHHFGEREAAQTLLRNLENDVRTDDAPDASVVIRHSGRADSSVMATAHWGDEFGWWRWHDGAIESTAMALRALVTIDPNHRLVEPAMNWLVKNRRGAQWNNTRDTALSVLALNDYLKKTKELGGGVSFDIVVNGRSVGSKTIEPGEMIAAPSLFVVDPSVVDNENEIVITRTGGTSPLYFAAQATYFSLEEPVTPAGNEIFVKRDYYRVVLRPTLLAGFIEERQLLRDGDSVKSGDRIEVEATVEVKNNYEYLMFEDLKPAGFEAIALRSGEPMYAEKLKLTGVEKINGARESERERRDVSMSQWMYQELRDRKVVMFADRLSQGIWRFRYTLRAQTPGAFHALPMIGSAMYVPELRGNSAELRVSVSE